MAFRMTEVAAGVHWLEDLYTNWYLLEDGGRLTLVDAGLPADWASLPRRLVASAGPSLASTRYS